VKAAIFHGPRDVRCETVERPRLVDGQALLRVKACGICGSDLHTYRHGLFPQLGAPVGTAGDAADGRILGHEFSGEIVETQGDVAFAAGDRVVTVGVGANAEYVRVDASAASLLTRIADTVGFDEAATTEPLATSLHAVNLAQPRDAETHVVMGAGIIGFGVLQCLRARCSATTIVVDRSSERLSMASKLGADVIIDARDGDAVESILAIAGGSRLSLLEAADSTVDTVYDCAGLGRNQQGTSVLAQSLAMVRQGGTVVVVAVFERPVELDVNVLVRKGAHVMGSWTWSPEEFAAALDLIQTGRIDRKPLITHRFALDDARTAYETQLREQEAIKVMFTP